MKYYLGLDMGTNSIGWAVTDANYRILRAKGKDLWGIREFDEAEVSVDRRSKRVTRRRRQREQVRIGLLKTYFSDEIEKVDENFYARLDNSFFFTEDKEECVRGKYAIFHDKDYTDRDYYKGYPTIFHLRMELIHNPNPHDVRLVYLAILNLFKHRGHFLNGELGSDGEGDSKEVLLQNYLEKINELCEVDIENTVDCKELFRILGDRKNSRTQKKEKLANIFQIGVSDKPKVCYLALLCGLKVKAAELFQLAEQENSKYTICFNDNSFEEKVPEIVELIGGDNYALIEAAKAIYDESILMSIIGDYKYLSEARVASYEKHKQDLRVLKAVVRKYCNVQQYDELFRSDSTGTYGAYVKSVNTNGTVSRRGSDSKGRGQDALYKNIVSLIKPYEGDAQVDYILEEIEKENFLPKQLDSKNGTIPNQIHLKELKAILDNASSYFEFLNQVDESGLSTKERIIRLFHYQIPYFIGPVSANSAKNGGNGWVIRKEEGTVYPWNLQEKVDVKATQVEFIRRLIRNCSYLNDYKVLPKSSLLYERYCVLNEINNLKIDGEPISVQLKQDIFHDVFESGQKVTRKGLEKYLISVKRVITDGAQLSGIDVVINNSLSTYAKFLPLFGDKLKEDTYIAVVERIVFLSTVYGESKAILKDILRVEFPDILDEAMIKRIAGYKFKDWGRLSKEFLELSGCNKVTGECMTIISALWDTNKNLMELINDEDFSFAEDIGRMNTSSLNLLSDFCYEDLADMYYSAPVKRMIWQTILLIKELKSILGEEPSRVFVEMTRGDEEKKRTVSRKNELLELYREEADEWKNLINQADSDGTLRSKKMYLYLKQFGRCMYTGEPIDLDQLFDDNVYDIDHIYPRSKVKDDNINNNLVLVKKQTNASKRDIYPVDEAIYRRQREFWKKLWTKKYINDEKYKRLTCRNGFTEEQLSGFIARQLVETSQGTKGVAELIKQLMPETTIVYSKARNVSEFRTRIGMLKCRSINEMHHAHDAYLNIVVGNVYFVKFTQNPWNYIKNEYSSGKSNYNLNKMFDHDVVRGDEVAWIAQREDGNPGTIAIVKKMLTKSTPLLTRLSYTGHGAISNETLYSADVAKRENYIPIKKSDPRLQNVERYGGFTSLNPAYFVFIEYGPQKKRKKCFDVVPLYHAQQINNPEDLKSYFETAYGYEDVRIICPKIKKNSLLRMDGYYVYISGLDAAKKVEFYNGTTMIMGNVYVQYIHALEAAKVKGYLPDTVTAEANINLYEELIRKHQSNIMANAPKPLAEILVKGADKFRQLEVALQADVLLRIVMLTSVGRCNVSLKEIGGPSENGRIRISGNMTNRRELLLINQSVTGLISSEVDLLKG